jgi:hypothetical protein
LQIPLAISKSYPRQQQQQAANRGGGPVTMINGQAEVPAKPQEVNDVVTHIASDRNIANAEHPVALVTQDPNTNEHLFIWDDIRQAAAQPKK